MGNQHKLNLGFAPTRRVVFDKHVAGRYKDIIRKKISEYDIDIADLSFLNSEGLLFNALDADKVADEFIAKKVDAVFIPHCNFGTEDAVARLCKKVRKPVLLWGPRDEGPDKEGYRLRDSQCGLFATSKVLMRYGVKFTYITNSNIDDEMFDYGFKNFISVVSMYKAFTNMRIGQISTRPQPFWSVICNEGELLERFGIETIPSTLVGLEHGVLDLIKNSNKHVKDVFDDIKTRFKNIQIDDERLMRLSALKLYIKKLAADNGLQAVCLQCWNDLQVALDIMPCFINSELTNEGLPSICETDIHGVISSLIALASIRGREPIFFADMTIRHPEKDNVELLWHCGNFPCSLAESQDSIKIMTQFGSKHAAAGDWAIKKGDISLMRFDGADGKYQMLMGNAKGVSGPYTRGTYLWAEFNDWPLWEHRFIYGPYIHHCVGVFGDVVPALYEFCKYIPGLVPDPVYPEEKDILKKLR